MIPALLVLVMVIGAWGTAIVPIASSETTGGRPAVTPTRSSGPPSLLDPGAGPESGNDASTMGVSGDVSRGIVVNDAINGRTDMQPVPTVVGYNPSTGRVFDNQRNILTMDPAMLPQDSGVSFVSRSVPREELLASDPAPTAGGVDAGGPYGGPDTFEGSSIIEFTAVVSDPSLAYFRWDFNNDGKWDTGTPANPWTDQITVTHAYDDDYYGVAVLEAWDGISTYSVRYTGWTMGSPSPTWYLLYYYYWTVGTKFKAKQTMTVNQLSFYRYLSTSYYGFEATLWDAVSQAKLGECSPTAGSGWQRCTMASAVTLTEGKEYVISQRLGTSSFNFYYARGVDKPADTDQVSWQGMYYTLFTPSPAFPSTFWLDTPILAAEFYYDYTVSFPLTVQDTADVEVNNVAPVVYDLHVSPDNVLEGKPAEFSAMFNDPGLGDQWQFRWCYGDGTCDAWGGIKVGSGLSQLSSILVYSDVAPHYAARALDFYGVTYKFTSDIFSLPGLITGQHWDMIIYQSYYIAYIAPIIEDAMMTQIAGGAVVIYNNWYANNRNSHPLLAYFGARTSSSLTSPLTMYAWEPTNDLFNTPLQPPLTLTPTHNQYFTDGFRLTILSNAFDPLGYTNNRQQNQAAMAVRNDLASIFNGFTPQNYQGDSDFDGDPDMLELMVNEIRLVTGPEVPRSMPWPVPTVKHVYRDDDPMTGTPFDSFSAQLEVKDDDDGKLRGGSLSSSTNFESGSPWPTGWTESEGFAWTRGYSSYLTSNSALYWYFYDFSPNFHRLTSQAYDLSTMDLTAPVKQVTLTYRHSWEADYPFGLYQDGYVDVSSDNFATFTTVAEYHHLNPAVDQGTRSFDISEFAGASNVRVRLSIRGYDDWWWHVDDVQVSAFWGTLIAGLGTGTSSVVVNNVAPQVYGGPTSGLTGEAIPFNFVNYKIDDPTLWDPKTGAWNPTSTEWFAYRWNFDDGTTTPWVNTGTLQVPKVRVLFLHTLSFGTGDQFVNMVRNIDIVGTLDTVDFLFLSPAQIPSLTQMLTYDAIVFATNYAVFSSTFDITRREIGNRLADYMDIKGGGVVTLMATYDNSPFYGDLFTLLGRYTEEDYGAFEKTQYAFESHGLGTVYQANHPVMAGVAKLSSPLITSGDYPLTAGTQLLADWDNGNSAIGVKEMPNGARSVNIGSFSGSGASVCGGDCNRLLRNAIQWSSHTLIPTNDVTPQIHTFGDNGLYNVDLQLIDDDMGFTWDAGTNSPVAIPGETPTISHTVVPVEIQNRDPTIDTSSIDVFIAANVCLRVSGKEWNTVSLKVFTDGIQTGGVSVTRMSGGPNDQAKCAFTRIDLMQSHSFGAEVTFTPAPGATSGSNPWWVIVEPWREPITPGHGSVTFSGGAQVEDPATYLQAIDLGNLKQALLDSGHGARIDFSAIASDPGTDDLAFVWMWSDGSTDTVNVHRNLDGAVTQGAIGDPQFLGFGEPYFDRAANTIRSPGGTTDFTVRDNAIHAYGGSSLRFWVVLIVLDDDNSRGYPSTYFHDGTDMEFVFVDLT